MNAIDKVVSSDITLGQLLDSLVHHLAHPQVSLS